MSYMIETAIISSKRNSQLWKFMHIRYTYQTMHWWLITNQKTNLLQKNFSWPGTFTELPRLRYIHLEYNRLQVLEAGTINLQYSPNSVYLYNNDLISISEGAFVGRFPLPSFTFEMNCVGDVVLGIRQVFYSIMFEVSVRHLLRLIQYGWNERFERRSQQPLLDWWLRHIHLYLQFGISNCSQLSEIFHGLHSQVWEEDE